MNENGVPTLGVRSLTTLVSSRSAHRGATVTLDVLLAGLGSGSPAAMIRAVLTIGLQPATRPMTVRVAVELAATVPINQTLKRGLTVPCETTTRSISRPAGTRSCTATRSSGMAAGLVTVRVKVTVPPTSGWGLSTVLSSARSTGVGGGGVGTVIVLWADSLPGLQSNVPVSETVATFVKVPACGAMRRDGERGRAAIGHVADGPAPRRGVVGAADARSGRLDRQAGGEQVGDDASSPGRARRW